MMGELLPPVLNITDESLMDTASLTDSTHVSSPYSQLRKSLSSTRDIIVDVRANGAVAHSSSRLGTLVAAVRELGKESFWGNDVLEAVSKRGGYRLNIIAQDALLCGFVVYKVDLQQAIVEIKYIAIPKFLRGQGCGTKLIRWIQLYAQNKLTNSQVSRVACSCVPEALKFYQHLGFKKIRVIEAKDEKEANSLIPGQLQMEWKIPNHFSSKHR